MPTSAAPLSRRAAIRLGAGSLGAVGLAARAPSTTVQGTPAARSGEKATFVLVPGQWTGAFVWHTVAPRLREAGHDVYAVTCTGLGERVHLASPAIDLDTFVTDVVNVLEYEELHDVILVGHSLGGMMITGVAERVPERISQLVYLDATVPLDGQNAYDFDFPDEAVRHDMIAADALAGAATGMPGFLPVSSGVTDWVRSMMPDQAEAEWFISRLVPHPVAVNLQPIRLDNPAAEAIPRTFILCTADKDMHADPVVDPYLLTIERVRSDPNWRIIEVDDNHVAPLNNPQGTAEVLLSLL